MKTLARTLLLMAWVASVFSPAFAAAPAIVEQPQSQTAAIGTDVILRTLATGTEPLTYQWRRNGLNIPNATNSALQLSNVQTNDTGRYVAVTADLFGSVTSQVAILTVLFPSELSATPRTDFWIPDGRVSAILETNGIIYLGGEFEHLSPNWEKGEVIDTVTGLPDLGFPKVDGTILEALPDGEGGWFIGGEFNIVGGTPRANLAHILPDNTVDPSWTPAVQGFVYELVLSSNNLYFGGMFTNVAGQSRKNLACVDATSGALKSWNPTITHELEPSFRSRVFAMALNGKTLYVGGFFNRVGNQLRDSLAAIDIETGVATAWNPAPVLITNLHSQTINGAEINDLAIKGDILYIAGTFTAIRGQTRSCLAAINLVSDTLTPWNPEANDNTVCLLPICDTIYVGGYFTQVGRQPRNCIAALDTDKGDAKEWNPDIHGSTFNASVYSLLGSRDVIYAGGIFSSVGGTNRDNVAAIGAQTGKVTPWNPGAGEAVSALALSGSKMLIGDTYSKGGVVRRYLAALDARTGKVLPWNPTVEGPVTCLTVASNTLYVGNNSSNVLNQAYFVGFDLQTGAARSWRIGLNNPPSSLTVGENGDRLYMGGSFTSIGNSSCNYLARFGLNGEWYWRWDPKAFDQVYGLTFFGTKLYAAGAFPRMGSATRNNFAAVLAATGTLTGWNPDAAGSNFRGHTVYTDGNLVYLGGTFETISGQPRENLAAVDPTNGLPTSWRPRIGPSGANVQTIAIRNETLYAGGFFLSVGDVPRNSLAGVDLSTGLPTMWDPSPRANFDGNPVSVIASGRTALYAGGFFSKLGGQYWPNFAAFTPTNAPRISRQPKGQIAELDAEVTLSAEATGAEPLSFQWQFNGADILGATNSTLVLSGLQVTNSGIYTLVVTNSLGLISSAPAELTVLQPLTIMLQPSSQVVAPGTTVVLTVEAGGHPTPHFQWRLNGVNIPGAVNPTLVLPNAQPKDGGSYEVVVANFAGAVCSDIARVTVTSPGLPFGDNLLERGIIAGFSGVGSGSNVIATREVNEPYHAGKRGLHSVWLSWTTPSNGIATLNTRGSDFDTLLAVYTGSSLGDLVEVASDEDHGEYATSKALFNAVAGTEYLIAVDGFARNAGNIVLTWNLDTTNLPLPRILSPPNSQAVSPSDTVQFTVLAYSPSNSPLGYQWFRDCDLIPGATNSTFSISNVQFGDVGNYWVRITNASREQAVSDYAYLEIGSTPDVVFRDKLEDLFPDGFPGSAAPMPFSKGATANVGAASGLPMLVSVGTIDARTMSTSGATTSTNEIHCNVQGGKSAWMAFRVATRGWFQMDTIGSSFDTVLAVYRSINEDGQLEHVTCNNDISATNKRSLVRFKAYPGTDYCVAVDGVGYAYGTAKLNWKFGLPPSITSSPANAQVRKGETAVLSVSATNALPGMSYQWYLNAQPIVWATNATLTLTNAQAPVAGTNKYSVVVKNFAGARTNSALVLVEIPRFEGTLLSRMICQFQFSVNGTNGQNFVLKRSTDLLHWEDCSTNIAVGGTFRVIDDEACAGTRFYQAVPIR